MPRVPCQVFPSAVSFGRKLFRPFAKTARQNAGAGGHFVVLIVQCVGCVRSALDAERDAHAAADAQGGETFLASRFCIRAAASPGRARRRRRSDGRWRWRRVDVDLAGSQPISLFTAEACAANARWPRSGRVGGLPAGFLSAAREAGIGPVPMMAGSTPACAPTRCARAASCLPWRPASPSSAPARGAVIDARRIAGGHRAVLLEADAAWSCRRSRRRGAALVGVDHDVALAGLDGEGNDSS